MRLESKCPSGYDRVMEAANKKEWGREGAVAEEHMLALFKFGREDHLTAFRNAGLMHMRTMQYFAAEERDNPARGDRFEGASTMLQPQHARITISSPLIGTHEIDPNDLVGPTFFSLQHRSRTKHLLHVFPDGADASSALTQGPSELR